MTTAKLNGRSVSVTMRQRAEHLKRAGGKAWLIIGPEQEQGCANCNGHGYFHLQHVSGGPFDSVPPTVSKFVDGQEIHIIAVWHDGAWYQAKIQGYRCPVCAGQAQQEAPAKERRKRGPFDNGGLKPVKDWVKR